MILAGATRPRVALAPVDWSLLLFLGELFVVMRGVADARISDSIVHGIARPLDGARPVANIIVFETARREGVEAFFFEYLRLGLPLTVLTLVLAWAWI